MSQVDRHVAIRLADKEQQGRIRSLKDGPERYQLALTVDGHRDVLGEGNDYFDALTQIRRKLAVEGAIPLCLGAARSVYPSGMSRSMGGGLMAYRLTMGQQALRKDLVSIFDLATFEEVATVDEQKKFFDAWLASLK